MNQANRNPALDKAQETVRVILIIILIAHYVGLINHNQRSFMIFAILFIVYGPVFVTDTLF